MKLSTPSLILTIQIFSWLPSISRSQLVFRINDNDRSHFGGRRLEARITDDDVPEHQQVDELAGLSNENLTLPKAHGPGVDNTHGSKSTENQKLPNKCGRIYHQDKGLDSLRRNCSAVQDFADGDKLLITGKHPDNWMYCVDVPDEAEGSEVKPIQIKKCRLEKNEQWVFYNPSYAPDASWAVIKSVSTGECFDVLSDDTEDSTIVSVSKCSETEEAHSQLWKVVPQGDGTVRLKNYNSCKCLTIQSLDKSDCEDPHVLEVLLSECNGNPKLEQDWTLRKVAKHSLTLFEHPNYQGFRFSLLSNGECVDVPTNYDDTVRSLNVHGSCWVVYKERNCQGEYFIFTPEKGGEGNAIMEAFVDVISSAVPCTALNEAELRA